MTAFLRRPIRMIRPVGQPKTSELRRALGEAAVRLVDRAHAAGVLQQEIGPDDLRRLSSGMAHAARLPPARPEDAERYVGVLLDALRPRAAGDPRAADAPRP